MYPKFSCSSGPPLPPHPSLSSISSYYHRAYGIPHLNGGGEVFFPSRSLGLEHCFLRLKAASLLLLLVAGMDPYSRRFTWDLLRRGRAGRCTLLSTHFMEEAEHLGDRVAMLRKGRLRCAGSPLFLKSRWGPARRQGGVSHSVVTIILTLILVLVLILRGAIV